MKKFLLICGMMLLSALGMQAASDRIDFIAEDGTFFSIMADDISEVLFQSNDQNEVTTLVVYMTNGSTRTVDLTKYTTIKCIKADPKALMDISLNQGDGNAEVHLLDCYNNRDAAGNLTYPGKPEGWRGEYVDGTAHFYLSAKPGYDADVRIVGDYTGKVYTDDPDFLFDETKETLGIPSKAFYIPNEPVTMYALSFELNIYDDLFFLGTYQGACINQPNLQIVAHPTPTFSITYRGSGAYSIETDDVAKGSVDMNQEYWYEYNGDTNTLDWQKVEEISGSSTNYDKYRPYARFLQDGVLLLEMRNVNTNKLSESLFYIIGKKPVNFTAVTDEYGYRHLIEYCAEDGGTHYLTSIEHLTMMDEAMIEMRKGETLDGVCDVIVTPATDEPFRYIHTAEGEVKFLSRGKEVGSYLSEDGLEVITLDGFGRMVTLSGTDYEYTIEGNVITVQINGTAHQYVLDPATGKYSEIFNSSEWTAATHHFLTTSAHGMVEGRITSDITLELFIDSDPFGASTPGEACLRVMFPGQFGYSIGARSYKYIYDADAKRFTVTGVEVGSASGSYSRQNITFCVSDDLRSMWLDDATVAQYYSSVLDESYVQTGRSHSLMQPYEEPAEDFNPYYAGYAATYYNTYSIGNQMRARLTLDRTGDKYDSSAREQKGWAYFWVLPSSDIGTDYEKTYVCWNLVEYVKSGNRLTLKNCEFGSDSESDQTFKTDVVFEKQADGTLRCLTSARCYGRPGTLDDVYNNKRLYSFDLEGLTLE